MNIILYGGPQDGNTITQQDNVVHFLDIADMYANKAEVSTHAYNGMTGEYLGHRGPGNLAPA